MRADTEARIAELVRLGQASPNAARRAIMKMADLMREPTGHPQGDFRHPPAQGNWLTPMMAPSKFLVAADTPTIAAGAESTSRLEFSSGPGWIVAFKGSVQAVNLDNQAYSEMGLRLTINDGEELITNGVAQDFARYSDLFPMGATSTGWSPFVRHMGTKDVLWITWHNYSDGDLVPTLLFAFARDPLWAGSYQAER